MTTNDSWTKRINIQTLDRLEEKFNTLYAQSKFKEAEEIIEQALLLAKETYGTEHPYYTACLSNKALLKKKLEEEGLHFLGIESLEKGFSFLTREWKGKIIVFFIIVMMAASGAVYETLKLHQSNNDTAVAVIPVEDEHFPLYKVNARFNPQDKTIQGEEEVFFKTGAKGNQVYFNLYFNRYNDKNLNVSEMRHYAYSTGQDLGYIDILSVSYKGRTLKFSEEGEILKVYLDEKDTYSSVNGLKISFKLKIPYISDRSGANSKGIWLGNWLPTLASGRNLHETSEIGDDFVNISSTYKVSFFVPKGYDLVLSNIQDVRPKSDGKIYICDLERVRDLPIFLNRGYKHKSVQLGQTKINLYYLSDDSMPLEVLNTAHEALDFFSSYVGEYPWKELNIVENNMYLNGMEYSTMVLISSKAIKKSMPETIFHEVGHQWFYNIIGSDQYRAAFIDEGMVEFFGYYVLKRQIPQTWKYTTDLNKSLSQFQTWKEYREVHYHDGSEMFENLLLVMGKTEFEKFIKEYYDKYKFSLVSPEEFKDFLAEKVGQQQAEKLLNY